MSSIFNPSGGTIKIFVDGLGEVEVRAGGIAPGWKDEPTFTRERKCPHCGQALETAEDDDLSPAA